VLLLAPVLVLASLSACAKSSDDEAADEPTETSAAPSTTAPLVGVLTPSQNLLAGQCFDELPDPTQQPFAVLIIPCEDAHTYEIYLQSPIEMGTPVPNGTPYPGALAVANAAEAQCFAQFAGWMGIQWEASDYDIVALWPSEPSWNAKTDRTILCAVYRVTGGTTTGSVRGSEQ